MSAHEWLVIAIAGAAGYWLVSFLLKGRAPSPSNVEAPPAPSSPDATPWHTVLGLAPDADAAAIRAAYQRLISQYHPDKVETLGPEIREVARRKSQEITEAYRQALASLDPWAPRP